MMVLLNLFMTKYLEKVLFDIDQHMHSKGTLCTLPSQSRYIVYFSSAYYDLVIVMLYMTEDFGARSRYLRQG